MSTSSRKLLQRLSLTTVLAASALWTGCKTAPGHDGSGGNGGSDSILASLGGISQTDANRSGLHYTLICGSLQLAASPAPAPGDLNVAFPAAQVKTGDKCAIEVRVDNPGQFTNWQWFGKDKTGTPIQGLMYGSDLQAVQANRSLGLTLYQLYSVTPPASAAKFSIVINASIDPAAAFVAPASAAALSASLTCAGGPIPGGTVTLSGASKSAVEIDFKQLDASKWSSQACSQVSLLVGSQAQLSAKTPDLTLGALVDGQVVTVPPAGATPYVLSAIAPSQPPVTVVTQPGGTCLSYDANNNCLDVKDKRLPFAQAYVVAKVHGVKAGQPFVLWAVSGNGSGGMGLLSGGDLKITDVAAALTSQAAGTTPPTTLPATAPAVMMFYTVGFEGLFKAQPMPAFDDPYVGAAQFAGVKAQPADLAGFTALSLDEVWTHGFHAVADATLGGATAAIWLNDLVSTKAGQPTVELMVGGTGRYFDSASAPVQTQGGQSLFFDLASYLNDMALPGGPVHWSTYALAGGAMAPAGCAADKTYYLGAMSTLTLGGLTGVQDPKIDGCAVAPAGFNAAQLDASTWAVTSTYYAWDWFQVK